MAAPGFLGDAQDAEKSLTTGKQLVPVVIKRKQLAVLRPRLSETLVQRPALIQSI